MGPNAEKWLSKILDYKQDPSKFDLPELVFHLPELDSESIEDHLKLAASIWNNVSSNNVNPFNNLEKIMPFWVVFTLPRRPAVVYYGVWSTYFKQNDLTLYAEAMYRFQDLFQNFIREELGLFKIVKPFRKKLGRSLIPEKQKKSGLDHPYTDILEEFSNPQKLLDSISSFVDNKPVKAGIAYLLLIERLAVVMHRNNKEQINASLENFHRYRNKYDAVELPHEIASPISLTTLEKLPELSPVKPKRQPKLITNAEIVVEFERIQLKEFDGFVQISGHSSQEQRNFRIMNCLEEDILREEMWRERKYKIRTLVNSLLAQKYSSAKKLYTLKRGVDIEIQEPNWLE